MTWLETVLGGVLATLAGLVVMRAELYYRSQRQREQWDRRFNRLLGRLEHDYDKEDDLPTDTRRAYFHTASEVVELMEDHLTQADRLLSDETLDQFDNLRKDVARLEGRIDRSITDQKVVGNICNIAIAAKELEEVFNEHDSDN